MTGVDPDPQTPWPSIEEYALAHRCPVCLVAPGEPCNAPRKRGRSHLPRLDEGARHRTRDIGRAPWPEDRVVGQRYDSLGNRYRHQMLGASP